MPGLPSNAEEHATSESETRERYDKTAGTLGRFGVALGAVALIFVVVLGGWLVQSVRRMNRQMTQIAQQMDRLNRRMGSTEQQSQSLAQQASQAAASAQAAATQRDEAKQSEQDSAAQAAAAKQQAAEAEQKAEEYRKQHEEELQQLQTVLGQIAETHRTAVGLVMTLGEKSIRFDFNKADVKPQYRDTLNRIAGVLMTLQQYSIYVYGYTDDVGTQDYNVKLSTRRAEAVRDALVQAGIKPDVMTTKGFGKSDPRAKGESAQARSANRRVEIGLVDSRLVTEPLAAK
jgi:outer membrane protein OmpA-like peptidoglycan-associated protein